MKAIEQGILTKTTKERLEALESEKEDIEIAITKAKIAKPRLTKENIEFWLNSFKNTDLTDILAKKKLVDIFVNKVYHYVDRIVIIFNISGVETQINLADMANIKRETADKKASSNLKAFAPPMHNGQLVGLSKVLLDIIIKFYYGNLSS